MISSTATGEDDLALLGCRDDVIPMGSGRRQRHGEGRTESTRLDITGANIAENIKISAKGGG